MPLTCFVTCLYWVSWSNVFWIVVCDGLLPTVKAGSKVSMSPSTATTSVSSGVLATNRRLVRVAALATPPSEPPTLTATAAAAPFFKSSSRVSRLSNGEVAGSTDALSFSSISILLRSEFGNLPRCEGLGCSVLDRKPQCMRQLRVTTSSVDPNACVTGPGGLQRESKALSGLPQGARHRRTSFTSC